MNLRIIFFITNIFLITNQAMAQCEGNYAALVFNDKNNNILFENRADEIIYPASLTKIMTAYLVFEALASKRLHLGQKIIISHNSEDIGKVNKINTLNLKFGDQITVENALKGMLVKSFNETASALAEAVAGDELHFAQMMNKKAFELKMYHTNFRNSSGLHDDGHYTTGYDLARLVNDLEKKFPQYRKYFSLTEFNYNGEKFENTNHILTGYKGADGFKTGFTSAAGFNLISSAKLDGRRVNAILTGCETSQKRDEFMKVLLDDGFKKINTKNLEIIVSLK